MGFLDTFAAQQPNGLLGAIGAGLLNQPQGATVPPAPWSLNPPAQAAAPAPQPALPAPVPPVAPPATPAGARMSFRDWVLANPSTVSALASAFMAGPSARGAIQNLGQTFAPAMDADKKRSAVNAWLKAKSSGQAIDPDTAALLQNDPSLADSYLQSVVTPKAREIRMDPNGVPRYVDNGAEVFPGVKQDNGPTGIFSGKSIMGQGLNYLISTGAITEDQAAQLAASKPVVGADGTVYLATPQGIFGNGKPLAQPGSPDLTNPDDAGTTMPPTAPGSAPSGMIPLTGQKTFGSEDQTKNAGFAKRMIASDAIIGDPASATAGTSYAQKVRSNLPFGLDNYAVSDDYQKLDQAERDFVNAVLRRESGAAISQSEFDNARKQYFPQPGDTEATLKQKAVNRQNAIESVKRAAGPLNQDFIGQPTPPAPATSSGTFEWHPDTGLKQIQ